MHDGSIQISRLITAVLWITTALLYAAAWVVTLTASWHIGAMLAFTGCLFAGLAGVSQVRCYSLRICGLMRVTAGLDIPATAEVTPMRVR
jgi:hypothetical protein